MTGIVSWGAYIPRLRIRTEDIARAWGDDPRRIVTAYYVFEKAVPNHDEDSVTMAIEAARRALRAIDRSRIGAVFVGTESKPYAVKPIASILIDALGLPNNSVVADLEFACKAASDALIAETAMVNSGKIDMGLVVASDASQGEPGEHLDYSVGAGAVAFVVGKEAAAEIEAVESYVSDTPDFWRRDGSPYPRHGEGFTGEPAYFRHVVSAAKLLMEKHGYRPEDFDYVVLHQPNGRFPVKAAAMLGIPTQKLKQGLVTPHIGNLYNGSALIGLASVLDVAKPGQRILLVTFGSGAGSNAFAIRVTDRIEEVRQRPTVWEMIERGKIYIDYATYLKNKRMIKLLE